MEDDIMKYYFNKTEFLYKESEIKLKSFGEYINRLKETKCKNILDSLTNVSEQIIYLDDNDNLVKEFKPKSDEKEFQSLLNDYDKCVSPFEGEIIKMHLLKKSFKDLNNKLFEICANECLDDKTCLLNCVNNLRFNFKSYYDILESGIKENSEQFNI